MSQQDDTPDQSHAIERFSVFINQLREILALAMEQPLDDTHLDAMLQRSESMVTLLRQHRQKRALPLYNVNFPDGTSKGERYNNLMPYSPVSGDLNPIAPPLRYRGDGDKLCGEVSLGAVYEGPPNSVHGAVIAAIYDQLLAFANVDSGSAGPTATLKVNYLKPTPLNTPLTFVAWKAEQNGRKVLMRGECHANGELLSDCEGLFIQFRPQGANPSV